MLIAGATAEVAVESVADLLFRRLRIPHQQLMRGENHSRSAETALQPVTLPKSLLERMELFLLGQTFDCQNISALRLHRKHRARLHRCVVEHHCAGSADAGFAADVSARQPGYIPQKMHQQQPWLHFAGILDTVDPDRNFLLGNGVHIPRPYLNDTSAIKFLVACVACFRVTYVATRRRRIRRSIRSQLSSSLLKQTL